MDWNSVKMPVNPLDTVEKVRMTLLVNAAILQEAMELYGCKSKTEAVDLALRELVKRRYSEQLGEAIRNGAFRIGLAEEELEQMRHYDKEHSAWLDSLRNQETVQANG